MQRQRILYNGETGHEHVTVTYLNETFLLSQKTIAEMFGVEMPATSIWQTFTKRLSCKRRQLFLIWKQLQSTNPLKSETT